MALFNDEETEILLNPRQQLKPRLQKFQQPSNENSAHRRTRSSAYCVSGGLGGLGLIAAADLATLGPQQINFVGRRTRLTGHISAGLLCDLLGTLTDT
jgi:hypothetical protein